MCLPFMTFAVRWIAAKVSMTRSVVIKRCVPHASDHMSSAAWDLWPVTYGRSILEANQTGCSTAQGRNGRPPGLSSVHRAIVDLEVQSNHD